MFSSQVCNGHFCDGTLQPAASFTTSKHNSDGLYFCCKKCDAFRNRERKPKPFSVLDDASAPEAYCSVCGELKPACDFPIAKARRSGRQTICSACGTKRCKTRYAAKKAQQVMSHPHRLLKRMSTGVSQSVNFIQVVCLVNMPKERALVSCSPKLVALEGRAYAMLVASRDANPDLLPRRLGGDITIMMHHLHIVGTCNPCRRQRCKTRYAAAKAQQMTSHLHRLRVYVQRAPEFVLMFQIRVCLICLL